MSQTNAPKTWLRQLSSVTVIVAIGATLSLLPGIRHFVTGTPPIDVDHSTADIGTVSRGDLATAGFVLKNQSRSTIIVTGAETSCSCTTTSTLPARLLPHSTTEITFNVATKNLDKNTNLSQTVLLHLGSGDVIPLRIVGYVR